MLDKDGGRRRGLSQRRRGIMRGRLQGVLVYVRVAPRGAV